MARSRKPQPKLTVDQFFQQASSRLKEIADSPSIIGYQPHVKQEKFHSSLAKIRLLIGGNRSGKTHSGVAEDIYYLRGNHPFKKLKDRPMHGRIVGVSRKEGMYGILIPKFKQLIPPSLLINGSWDESYSKDLDTLMLSNGSTLQFMTYEQDLEKFAGASKDFVHFDEEPPESIFNENRARVIDVNGDVWASMTPLDGFTWSYDKLYLPGLDDDQPNYFTIEVDMLDNPHITAEAAALYLDSLDPEERRAREHGQYMTVGGKVYKNFDKSTHSIPYDIGKIGELLKRGWNLYETCDHGWNNPTAWLWILVSPVGQEPKAYVIDEHYAGEMTVAEHAAVVHEKRTLYGQPFLTTGDPAMKQTSAHNGTSIQTEYALCGIYLALEGVPTGRGSVGIGVEKVHQYLAKGKDGKPIMQIMESAPNLINQMGMLRWKTYKGRSKDENNRYEEIQKKDDHAPDSLRYGVTLMPDLQQDRPERPRVPDHTGYIPTPTIAYNIDPLLARMASPESSSGEYYVVDDNPTEWELSTTY